MAENPEFPQPLVSSPSLDHLRSKPPLDWAPSIALALGLSQSLPLYHHHLDPHLTSLATRDTVPCGVLVILGILDESEAPPLETKYDPTEHQSRLLSNAAAAQRARNEEMKMSREQAEIARRKRQEKKLHQFAEQSRMEREQVKERISKRQREAIGSSWLDAASVTTTTLRFLRAEKLIVEDTSVQCVVETFLVDLIRQEEHAISVCTLLNRWREWSDRGGMSIDDLEYLKTNKVPFL